MKKSVLNRVIVIVIIFLFIGSFVFPTISGSLENKYKIVSLDSNPQIKLESSLWVIGLMKIINRTSDYLEVINIFGVRISKGNYGGFFERNESLIIYGFSGYASRSIVIGTFDYIVRP
jgi:hypothetical protein